VFENPNHCHALTFFFYKINKLQKVTFELVAIERRVDDPVAPSGAALNPRPAVSKLAVQPQAVSATATNRLTLEENDRTSRQAALANVLSSKQQPQFAVRMMDLSASSQPLSDGDHEIALNQVDKTLMGVGLLDERTREVSEDARKMVRWEREFSLPTAGIIVKGCIDECNVCEPALREKIQLELEREKLENALLEKQIALLEKSQEYRCCPKGEEEDEEE
jgi:hypothetical protein